MLSTVPSEGGCSERAVRSRDLGLPLYIPSLSAFTKVNGEGNPTGRGEERFWGFNRKCVLTVLREKFLPGP